MIAALLIALATWAALFPGRKLLAAAGVIDRPNRRSSHLTPTVRGGGLVSVSVLAVFMVAIAPVGAISLPFALGLLAMMAVGLLDDLRIGGHGLAWATRLAVQTALAVGMCAVGVRLGSIDLGSAGAIHLGVLSWPVTIAWIVGVTNAFNFMDGLDGMLALQMVVIGISGWLLAGEPWGTAYLWAAASAAGFLPHNAPNARLFLGDAGSLSFGFITAVATVAGASAPRAPNTFLPLALLLGPILVDTSLTLLRRLAHRENVAEAHREHLYQRVHSFGYSHMRVSLAYALLTALCAAAAIAWHWLPTATLVVWLLLAIVYAIVRVRVMRRLDAATRAA
jgi:UDP-N-acetylmuramyl pentapeptide phosphotransferase/UDP-N-acetylglucosamine-1-phosphate transferase